VADVDLSELVTIRNPDTLEEREIPRGALPFFVNAEQPWKQLDAAGRVKAQPSTPSKEN
jgi:hypothetical protein